METEAESAPKFALYLEKQGPKVRIVILEDGEELVCRKESISALKKWIDSTEPKLFDGRLTLHREDGNFIGLFFLNNPVGKIAAADFLALIERTANGNPES